MPEIFDLNDIVDTQVDVADLPAPTPELGPGILITVHDKFAERFKLLKGSPTKIRADLEALGFGVTDPMSRMLDMALLQEDAPREIYIGRKDEGETWTETLVASRTATGGKFYWTMVETRVKAEQIECALWQHSRKWGLLFMCPSEAESENIAAGLDGNLLLTLRELGYRRTVLIPHKPTEASAADYASITSVAGPWNFLAALTTQPTGTSGVSASVIFALNYGANVPVTFAATAANHLGSTTGPFTLVASEHLQTELTVTPDAGSNVGFHYDALAPITVVSVDLATDTAALIAAWNASAAHAAVATASPGAGTIVLDFLDYDAHAFSDDSDGAAAVGEAVNQAAVDWRLVVSAQGQPDASIRVLADSFANLAAVTAAELGAFAVAAVGAAYCRAGDRGGADAGKFFIGSAQYGSGSTFQIKAGSHADFLTEVGLSISNATGAGDVVNYAAAQPAETRTRIETALTIPNATVTVTADDEINVRSNILGRDGAVQCKGGQLNNALKFTRSLVAGEGATEDWLDVGRVYSRAGTDLARRQGNWDNAVVLGAWPDAWGERRSEIHSNFGETFEVRTANRLPGEMHFGTTTQGQFIDAIVTGDYVALRLQYALKSAMDQASDSLKRGIDFTDEDAGVTAYNVCSGVLRELDAAGHIIADTEPSKPPSKPTGLDIPTIDQIVADDKSQRLFGTIAFEQRLRGKVNKFRVRGTLVF